MTANNGSAALAVHEASAVDIATLDLSAIERVIIAGDLSKLTPDERWNYYREICRSLGLNPLTQPFAYMTLQGKLTLYCLKGGAEQLRRLYHVSFDKPDVQFSDGMVIVSVLARDTTGRTDSDLGIVPIEGLKGDARANAILKAVTKAKRRATLSMLGLGMLDETEVETIPAVRYEDTAAVHGQLSNSAAEGNSVRSERETRLSALIKQAVEMDHPKRDKVQATDPSTLTDEVLVKSIDSLQQWIDDRESEGI